MGDETPNVDCDTQLDLVSDEARRELLVALLAVRDGTESSVSLEALDLDTHAERIEFHHVHLPKLAKYGIVDVIDPGESVAPGENFDAIEPLLDGLETARDEPLQSTD